MHSKYRAVRWFFRAFSAGFVLCLAMALRADEPAADAPPKKDAPPPLQNQFKNDQAPFFVRAEMVGGLRDLYEGDQFFLRVQSEVEAYLYVFYQQADGKVFLIFPNRIQVENKVAAKQGVQLPGIDTQFRWEVGAPFGKETIKVVASKAKLEKLDDPALHEQFFNRVTAPQVKGAEVELEDAGQRNWASVDLTFETLPKGQRPVQTAKRYGVFFGVGEYEFNQVMVDAGKSQNPPVDGNQNLNFTAGDARLMADTFRKVGKLTDAKVFVNSQATRRNMEKAITEWLPSVSKPGDTVVIFFSGHGTQAADLNDDEADGNEEFLCTHDAMGLSTVAALSDLAKAGKLKPEWAQRLKTVVTAADKRTGHEDIKKFAASLLEETCVSDDVLGHWLQRLAGRQVIVLLEACHSGGFANEEKVIATPAKGLTFDYVSSELTRLKGMGEEDQALLTACHASETGLEASGHAFLCHAMIETMRQTGPVSIETAHEITEQLFPILYGLINDARRKKNLEILTVQHATLMNLCKKPVVLKP